MDLFITYEDYTQARCLSVKYNREMAGSIWTIFRNGQGVRTGYRDHSSGPFKYPEVFTMEEQTPDEKELWTALEEVIRRAAGAVCGDAGPGRRSFKTDILEKLKTMDEKVDLVEARSPQIVGEYREKLEGKVKELLADTQIE